MDRQERAMLLLEQEETKNALNALEIELLHVGQAWDRVATALKSNPEVICFKNAPTQFAKTNVHTPTYAW